MKNSIAIILAAFLLCSSLSSMAQKPGKTWSAGFGIEAGIPTGNANKIYNLTAGLTARFALLEGPGYVTFTTGWNVFVPTNIDVNQNNIQLALQVPFKAGYKVPIGDHFFAMGELGYSIYNTYFDNGDGAQVTVHSGGFTYAPSIGVQFGVMEIGVRYESILLKNDAASFVGFRLGFNF